MAFLIPLVLCLIFGLAVFPRRRRAPESAAIDVLVPFHQATPQWKDMIAQLAALERNAHDRCILLENGSFHALSSLQLPHSVQGFTVPESMAGKKAALQWMVAQSTADWIFTTDADASLPPEILTQLRLRLNPHTDMVIAPVVQRGKHFWGWISSLESLCIWTLTAFSARIHIPISCSGAGLLFRRSAWQQVKGYSSHLQIPSGDDVLLMDALWRKRRHAIHAIWNKQALVYCEAPSTLKAWLHQHRRWASKSDHLRHPLKRVVLLGVMLWLLLPWLLLGNLHLLTGVLALEFLWMMGICLYFRIPLRVLALFLPFRFVYPFLVMASLIPNRSSSWQMPA